MQCVNNEQRLLINLLVLGLATNNNLNNLRLKCLFNSLRSLFLYNLAVIICFICGIKLQLT